MNMFKLKIFKIKPDGHEWVRCPGYKHEFYYLAELCETCEYFVKRDCGVIYCRFPRNKYLTFVEE